MVVDDDEIIVQSMQNILEEEGFGVIAARSGEECLDLLEEERPDYIFIDIQMPGMDGWETLQEIEKKGEFSEVPVAMLTAWPLTRESLEREGISRLVDYVVKPFSRQDIMQTLEQSFSLN